jgi:hypothetical protein
MANTQGSKENPLTFDDDDDIINNNTEPVHIDLTQDERMTPPSQNSRTLADASTNTNHNRRNPRPSVFGAIAQSDSARRGYQRNPSITTNLKTDVVNLVDTDDETPYSTKMTPSGARTTPRSMKTPPVVRLSEVEMTLQQPSHTPPLPARIGPSECMEMLPSSSTLDTHSTLQHNLTPGKIHSAITASGAQRESLLAQILPSPSGIPTRESPSTAKNKARQAPDADSEGPMVLRIWHSSHRSHGQDERVGNHKTTSTGSAMSLPRPSTLPLDRRPDPECEEEEMTTRVMEEVASPASERFPRNHNVVRATTLLPLRTSAHASKNRADPALPPNRIARKSAPSDPRHRLARSGSGDSNTHSTKPKRQPPTTRPSPEKGVKNPKTLLTNANQGSEVEAFELGDAPSKPREQLLSARLHGEQYSETRVNSGSGAVILELPISSIDRSRLTGQGSSSALARSSSRHRDNSRTSSEGNEATPALAVTHENLLAPKNAAADNPIATTELRQRQVLELRSSNATQNTFARGFQDTRVEVESSLKQYLKERYEDHAYLVKVSRDLLCLPTRLTNIRIRCGAKGHAMKPNVEATKLIILWEQFLC